MGLVEHIHPVLVDLDYRQWTVKIIFIFGSFLFFVLVYFLTGVVFMTTWTYRNLREKEKMFWKLAIVRAVYGIFCTVVGIWAIFVDTALEKDPVFATNPTSYFGLTVTVGFFVFECSATMVSDILFKNISIALNIHHWLSLLGYSTLMVTEAAHCFGTKGLILEMSTPFAAVCWTLLKAGKADTLLWRANQFILVHTFHLRSVVECSLWYLTYQHWNRIWSAMPISIFCFLYTELTVLTFLLTPYWTYKKTKQMIIPSDWNFEDSNASPKTQNGDVKKYE